MALQMPDFSKPYSEFTQEEIEHFDAWVLEVSRPISQWYRYFRFDKGVHPEVAQELAAMKVFPPEFLQWRAAKSAQEQIHREQSDEAYQELLRARGNVENDNG